MPGSPEPRSTPLVSGGARQIVLLGPPGSGKGTQGARLGAHYGIPLVGSGQLVREHIARRTPFGRKIEARIAAGNFAPDADILYWMRRRLEGEDARRGYVLDGFPRDLAQAQAFDEALGGDARGLTALELSVPLTVLTERIAGRLVCAACGRTYHAERRPPRAAGRCDGDGGRLERRPEDSEQTVPRRMEIYATVTAAVAEYYARDGRLARIDGDADEDDVFARLKQAIEAHRS